MVSEGCGRGEGGEEGGAGWLTAHAERSDIFTAEAWGSGKVTTERRGTRSVEKEYIIDEFAVVCIMVKEP